MPKLDRIIPVLTYQDIAAAHDFLVRAFGFDGAGVHRNAEGQAVHGEVRAGSATIWLHRVMAEHHLDSPQVSDVANSGLFVYVDDVDAHYEQARMAGARASASSAGWLWLWREPSRARTWIPTSASTVESSQHSIMIGETSSGRAARS